MGTIRDKMTADLDLRMFAATTKKEYLQRAQNFGAYYERPPTELGEREIREFLLYLVNDTGTALLPARTSSNHDRPPRRAPPR